MSGLGYIQDAVKQAVTFLGIGWITATFFSKSFCPAAFYVVSPWQCPTLWNSVKMKLFKLDSCWFIFRFGYIARFNKIATQGTLWTAADKETIEVTESPLMLF